MGTESWKPEKVPEVWQVADPETQAKVSTGRRKLVARKKQEVRAFLDPFIIEKIDKCVEEGDLGSSRSECIRTLLRDWARGKL